MLQRGHSGNRCDPVSTLCKYDLRKGDLIVLKWARAPTSEVRKYLFRAAMCVGGVGIILLLSLGARCLESLDVCI